MIVCSSLSDMNRFMSLSDITGSYYIKTRKLLKSNITSNSHVGSINSFVSLGVKVG